MINFGFGYPMGINSGIYGMNSDNTNVYFRNKYGCENCFRKEPYWQEYPKPVIQEPKNSMKRSFLSRFIHNIFGG